MSNTYRYGKSKEQFSCFENYLARRGHKRFLIASLSIRQDWYDFDKKLWERQSRDGFNTTSGASKGFKNASKTLIRRETKKLIKNCIDRDDWENASFPTDQDGKKYIWSYW